MINITLINLLKKKVLTQIKIQAKLYKREREDFVMGNLKKKHNTRTHLKKNHQP